jgi:hypothetical protein
MGMHVATTALIVATLMAGCSSFQSQPEAVPPVVPFEVPPYGIQYLDKHAPVDGECVWSPWTPRCRRYLEYHI